ncbi:MAG: lamin tail domain-containing protein [Sedimentisphaerales bacterium]|nr:lamin tail domain-containing protein [Sedimentisphaerales bacterium]
MVKKAIKFLIPTFILLFIISVETAVFGFSATTEATTPYGFMRQLNPSSRRSPLIISEIMYHPSDRSDDKDLEFVELFNTEPVDWDISGFRLEGQVDYTFEEGSILPGRSFLVVAAEPASIENEYGLTDVYGPYEGKLNNGGGTLRLINKRGGVLLEIEYDDSYPWPESADGLGHSVVMTKPDFGENNPSAWQASAERGGNPGTINTDGAPYICINEILANPGNGRTAFIELYNCSAEAVDISGYYLSDTPDELKFSIPDSTIIPSGGYVFFSASELSDEMSLSPNGEQIYLLSADQQCVLDAVTYTLEEPGISLGHFPNGTYGIRALAVPTPGYANSALYDRDIIINEIMYHPISENGSDEYVELYNKGTESIDLGGWKLSSGIRYTIPNGTEIAAGGYLVIAADAERLINRYPNLTAANTVGPFEGSLDNRGEKLILSKPLFNTPTNDEFIIVDELIYGDGGDWGKWADGGGGSLELKDPHSDNSRPDNWASSDDTDEAPWTTFSQTGILDHGSGTCDEVEIMMLDNGECIIDDIVVRKLGESNNRVSNGNFESGDSGWTIEGNHSGSTVENSGGYNNSKGMRIIATGDGDNLPNCLRKSLTSRLSNNETAIISARARWLRGNRNVLIRLHGNYMEAVGTLDVPVTLGTPGERNSTYIENTGPVIENTAHSPVLPESSQTIIITARVHDPDLIDSVTLYYRIDPSTSYTSRAMNDTGSYGDEVAGDGIYTGNISGRVSGTMIAFYVQAEDSAASPAVSRFPEGAPDKEALILVGDSLAPGVFGSYKMWVNSANGDYWSNSPKMSNEMIDGTFVYGDFRSIYNAGIRMRGSGWIRSRFGDPFTWVASYVVKVDKADRVMGATSLNLDNLKQSDVWGRGVLDPTFLYERMSFWIGERLGVETCYQRFILLYLNGAKKGVVFTDTQQPNGDYLRCWFPNDDDGHLFEADDWFEYDNGNPSSKARATLEQFTTLGGVLKQARYRWNWEKKVAHATDDDYTPLFELVDVMNSSSNYYQNVDELVDWDQWMRGFAVRRGAAADRDGYGYEAGKNAYIYKGHNTKWKYLLWDLDLGFGIERNYNAGLFSEINDPVLKNKFFEEPAFERAYWRALQDLVDGPMAAENFDPVADAYYDAFHDNGINTADPEPAKRWVRNRRGYIVSQLNSVASDFEITTNNGNNFSTGTSPYAIQGMAPVKIDAITVNGLEYPATWLNVKKWIIDVPLQSGQNSLVFQGYDSEGRELSGMNDSITITYTGQ